MNYEETEEHRRRASAWSNPPADEKARVAQVVENREHADDGYKVESGYAGVVDG